MGKITNAFKSQVGRDAGKAFSNWLWKDKHSTPYRRVAGSGDYQRRKGENKREYSSTVSQIEDEAEEIQQQKLLELQRHTDERVRQIAHIEIPKKKEELVNYLQELSVLLHSNTWGAVLGNDENKFKNQYADALFEKFSQCFFALQTYYPQCQETELYHRMLKQYKKKRNQKKHLITVFIIIFVGSMVLLSVLTQDSQKDENESTPLEPMKEFFNELLK